MHDEAQKLEQEETEGTEDIALNLPKLNLQIASH
jgi:hypothetical protein